ncbi:HTH-type transcriptional regulator CynR [Pseudooceanicola marinus]|uniref:HTH-type transcriptional regulator CynR n=1 Tax=Pseudooceanicola marinus TaxID=396013 RepID=A0A1X7A9Y1_9RHOB|nr:LysR family transcriptional regulator [Pseudooceanicola marinus]PJE25609.1 LysR family transcriptional regulator [Pseudooceanicola marinus]SLN73986.1 HTH-type transcriptional regulator CynR [Pseudooceanicola marinus]
MLSFRQLEVFRAVILTGSISGAAQQLGIAQPTVTNTIRRLEDVLGIQLFNRSGARLRPTALARQIFDVAAPSMTAFEQITDRVNDMVRGKGTMFRMGVSPSVSQALAPRSLSIFRRRRPEMKLRMDTLSMKQNRDYLWMAEGTCTVTIFPLDDPGISSFRVSSAGMVCVVPQDHPLATKTEVTVHDIAEEPLIFFHPNTPHGALVRQIFEAAGIEPNISIETRFAETAPHLMREGFGIALQDQLSAMGVTNPALKVLPLAGTPRQPISLHCRSDNVENIEVQEARRCLLQAALELGLPDETAFTS